MSAARAVFGCRRLKRGKEAELVACESVRDAGGNRLGIVWAREREGRYAQSETNQGQPEGDHIGGASAS